MHWKESASRLWTSCSLLFPGYSSNCWGRKGHLYWYMAEDLCLVTVPLWRIQWCLCFLFWLLRHFGDVSSWSSETRVSTYLKSKNASEEGFFSWLDLKSLSATLWLSQSSLAWRIPFQILGWSRSHTQSFSMWSVAYLNQIIHYELGCWTQICIHNDRFHQARTAETS